MNFKCFPEVMQPKCEGSHDPAIQYVLLPATFNVTLHIVKVRGSFQLCIGCFTESKNTQKTFQM